MEEDLTVNLSLRPIIPLLFKMLIKSFKKEKTMSYVENNLMTGENIIYNTKLHWYIFIWPIIWLLLTLLFIPFGLVAIIFLILSILTGISSLINYLTSEFYITDKRVIVKVGFIKRSSIEILLRKIEGIQVQQGIMGRVFGFGSIVITGTGGTKDPFHKISDPLKFRIKAQEQIELLQV